MEQSQKVADIGKLNEEFNNFMHRVNEVDNIIKKLASDDRATQEVGDAEAQRYLGEETLVDDENLLLKVTQNRTVINDKALKRESAAGAETSTETFMEEMSKDAEMRYQNKLVRKEKMETLKKRAALAFRRGDLQNALLLYTKAIEQIKDSALLYNNRALVYIQLGFMDKAREDLVDWALRVNEDGVKSWLLLAKVGHLKGDKEEVERCTREAANRNPLLSDFIAG